VFFLTSGLLTIAALAVAHALRLPSTVVALAAAAAGGQLLGRAAFTALGRHRRRATFAVLAVSATTALASAVAALVS
jgi:streptogramin lyase